VNAVVADDATGMSLAVVVVVVDTSAATTDVDDA
jgi:hypothetical protein